MDDEMKPTKKVQNEMLKLLESGAVED